MTGFQTPCFVHLLLLLTMLSPFFSAPSEAQSQHSLTVTEFRTLLAEKGIAFEAYSSKRRWNGERHPLILDTAYKRRFKTVLTHAAQGEPDFDGSLIIASWGCGSNCQHFAIIELETGTVHDGLTTRWGIQYHKESSLIILNDPENFYTPQAKEAPLLPLDFFTEYYHWDGTRLVLLQTLSRCLHTD